MDIIFEAADNYRKLLDIRYDLTLGRKGKSLNISLTLRAVDFFHLAGFQYLDYDPQLKEARERIFRRLLSDSDFRNSLYDNGGYPKIEERLELLKNLEGFLDDENLIFKYHSYKNEFSRIDADYIIRTAPVSGRYAGNTIYIFGSCTECGASDIFCRSLFLNNKTDYTRYQTRLTLLKISKLRISSGEILYTKINPNYVEK